jgi:hypothetical protein
MERPLEQKDSDIWDEEDLFQLLKRIKIVNKAFSYTVVCSVPPTVACHEALFRDGFTQESLRPVVVLKPCHLPTNGTSRASTADLKLIACFPCGEDCNFGGLPGNQENWPTLFHLNREGESAKDAKEQVGASADPNPQEQHPSVASTIIEWHTNLKHTVLVPFAGAGGEVFAAIRAGRDVVAIERDETQFQILVNRLIALKLKSEETSRFNF